MFYCPKASKSERNIGLSRKEKIVDCDRNPDCYSANVPFNRSSTPKANHHPTVKPLALIEYLVKLTTRKGQTVLDPFIGSGTTGMACKKLGMNYIGIELNPDYIKISENRIKSMVVQSNLLD